MLVTPLTVNHDLSTKSVGTNKWRFVGPALLVSMHMSAAALLSANGKLRRRFQACRRRREDRDPAGLLGAAPEQRLGLRALRVRRRGTARRRHAAPQDDGQPVHRVSSRVADTAHGAATVDAASFRVQRRVADNSHGALPGASNTQSLRVLASIAVASRCDMSLFAVSYPCNMLLCP